MASPTTVIDGRARARTLQLQVAFDVERLAGLGVRCGLATVLVGSDYAGLTFHIGARISALAGPGEILVSRTVRDLVVGSSVEFEDRGRHALKGVPGEWEVYAVA